MFEQVTSKEALQVAGTGLGLGITRALCSLMGGRVFVQSSPGKGSAFTAVMELKWEGEDVKKGTDDITVKSRGGMQVEEARPSLPPSNLRELSPPPLPAQLRSGEERRASGGGSEGNSEMKAEGGEKGRESIPLLRQYLFRNEDMEDASRRERTSGQLPSHSLTRVVVVSNNTYVQGPFSLYAKMMKLPVYACRSASLLLPYLDTVGGGTVMIVIDIDADGIPSKMGTPLSPSYCQQLRSLVTHARQLLSKQGAILSVVVLSRYTTSEKSILDVLPFCHIVRKPVTFDGVVSACKWSLRAEEEQRRGGEEEGGREEEGVIKHVAEYADEHTSIPSLSHLHQKCILVAEDDFVSSALLKRMLAKMKRVENFDIYSYEDGRQLLCAIGLNTTNTEIEAEIEVAEEEEPDVDASTAVAVIVDLHMPRIGGLGVAKALHRAHISCPIIIVSGEEMSKEERDKHGIFASLLKPFSQSDLSNVMKRVFEHHSSAPSHPRLPPVRGVEKEGVELEHAVGGGGSRSVVIPSSPPHQAWSPHNEGREKEEAGKEGERAAGEEQRKGRGGGEETRMGASAMREVEQPIHQREVEGKGMHDEVESAAVTSSSTPAAGRQRAVFADGVQDRATHPASIRREQCILVVDDEKICQLVAKKTAKSLGYTAMSAANGEEALCVLDQLTDKEIVAILMDVHMPRMDGLQCTREIRSRDWAYSSCLIIGTTAGGRREECLDAGMDEYIEKPFSRKGVKEVIDRYLLNGGSEGQRRGEEWRTVSNLSTVPFSYSRGGGGGGGGMSEGKSAKWK
uniref:Response regulatory domain-containing protein n=2 Tax=Palpitomonas bilix TaxID=652834 RepID=A0A7S3LWX1_9EUKA